ncbi:hypothetical protein GF357_02710 [Candidatus Dojkabacteria bacterium]|nr:hypothetical protein [Candidatus Dojkabacteria bacterium]
MKRNLIVIVSTVLFACACNFKDDQVEKDLYIDILEDLIDINRYYGVIPLPNGSLEDNNTVDQVYIKIGELNELDVTESTIKLIGFENVDQYFNKFVEAKSYNYFKPDTTLSINKSGIKILLSSKENQFSTKQNLGNLKLSDVRFNKELTEGILEFTLLFKERGGENAIVFIEKDEGKWKIIKKIIISEI